MRKHAVLASLGLLLFAYPATAQIREPEVARYRFVSEFGYAGALWVNPAWLGYNGLTTLSGHATWDRPSGDSWTRAQYLIALETGGVGAGYRHDEFGDPDGFAQGDAYTVAAGLGKRGAGVGVNRTWFTVGDNDASWDIGLAFVPTYFLTAGLVWRDIGSPTVRNTVRDERVIGAISLHPGSGAFSLSAEADFRTDQKDFRAFGVGANVNFPIAQAVARMSWTGDGDFLGFQLGAQLRFKSTSAIGLVGLDDGGDARVASAGVTANFQKKR